MLLKLVSEIEGGYPALNEPPTTIEPSSKNAVLSTVAFEKWLRRTKLPSWLPSELNRVIEFGRKTRTFPSGCTATRSALSKVKLISVNGDTPRGLKLSSSVPSELRRMRPVTLFPLN